MDSRADLIRHYRWLRQYAINDSHSGNVSVRDGTCLWITPSGACADILGADDLIRAGCGEPPPAGASLDAPLHLAVYRRCPHHGAVIHSHGAYTVAMTLDGSEFRPFAHFWLGEVLRSLPNADMQKAAGHFRTVIEKYPEHSKVPAALYKLASIQAERKEVAQARVTLNKILLKYPDSSEAKLAKTMLMQLEQEKGSS